MASGPYDETKQATVSLAANDPVSAYFLVGQRRISRCDLYTSADGGRNWSAIKQSIQASRATTLVASTGSSLANKVIGLGIKIALTPEDRLYAANCSLVTRDGATIAASAMSFGGTGSDIVVWLWASWIVA